MSPTRWAACFASSFVTRPAALITTRRLDLSASTEYIIRADFYVLISTDEFPQLLHFAFFVHIDPIMATRTGSAVWEGTLKEGKGKMKLGSGAFEGPYSFASRFENASGTNPEELIGAAEAGCFSMALSLNLEKAGHPPKNISTTAEVKLEPSGGGFKITSIDLKTEADVLMFLGGWPAFSRLSESAIEKQP